MQKKIVDQRRTFILLSYWLAIMALLLLLVAATYTWFSLSKTPRVNDMDLYVSSPSGLEIAQKFDAPDEDWGQSISFCGDRLRDVSPETLHLVGPGRTVLRSGIWPGRPDDRLLQPLSDSENANMDGEQGYYTMGTVYARSKTAVTVSLSEAVPMEDGTEGAGTYLIGTPVWNSDTVLHDNGGSGAEYAARIGLRVTPWMGKETRRAPLRFISMSLTATAMWRVTPATGRRKTSTVTAAWFRRTGSSPRPPRPGRRYLRSSGTLCSGLWAASLPIRSCLP